MTDSPHAENTPTTPTEPSATATIARIAIRNTLWVSLGSYSTQLIGFAATIVMTRLLTPAIFGFFSMATFWFTLLNLRTKSGLSYSAIQQPQTDGDLLGTYYLLDALTAAGSLVLALVAAIVLPQFGYTWEVSLAIVILMIADGITVIISPLSMVLEKEIQLSRLTLVTLFSFTVAYGVAILLALAGFGIWSLLSINVIMAVISIGGVYWVCKRRWPQAFQMRWHINRSLAKRLLKQGIPTGLSQTALSSIVMQFDNFLIGTFVGYEILGLYDRAYRIAHWPNLLLTMIVSRVGFLTFAKVQNDLPRLTHAVRLSLWILSTLGIPITLMLFFGASDIVGILYGPIWSGSAVFLKFLTIYSLVWPFVSLGFWLSVAVGQPRTTVAFTVVQAIAIVAFATPMTIQWGAMGTVFGVGITMVVAFIISCYYIFRKVPLTLRETFGAPVVAASLAIIAVLVLLNLPGVSSWSSWLRLIAIGIAGPGVYLAGILVLRPQETAERIGYIRRAWRKA